MKRIESNRTKSESTFFYSFWSLVEREMNEELAELSPKSSRLQFLPIFQKFRGEKIFLIIILRWIHGDPTTFLRKKLLSFSRKVVRSPWIYPLAMSLTLFTPNNNLFSLTCECSQFFKPFESYGLAIDRPQWGMKSLK